jgi:hypothetical protein
LVDEIKLKPPVKLTRNHKRSFFRRRRSSDDVWQKSLSATMTTLAAPTSSAPQQFSTETDATAANAANGTNEAANGAGKE